MKTVIIIEKDEEGRFWKRTPLIDFGGGAYRQVIDNTFGGGRTINITGDLIINVGGTLTVNTDQEDE